ncbi:MAG: hypothetical protein ACI4HI_14120 [Lachnospiraceae bacterium]
MFPCLGIFLAFILIMSFFLSRTKQQEKDSTDAFWDRERAANTVRRKDLSTLSYIQIPLDSFALGRHFEPEICAEEENLYALSQKKIVNLTGISNTDLKLTYGTANLDFLTECDTNCATLFRSLDSYAEKLLQAGDDSHAQIILEYAVSIHSDVSNSFLSLAKLYADKGESRKIEALTAACSHFDPYRQDSLKEKLLAIAHG